MAHLTRDEILARKTGRGTATLPDGSTVGIRALTRDEVLHMQGLPDGQRDLYAIATAVTDPVLTEPDVAAWSGSADAGDFPALIEAIQEISGVKQGAGKSGVSAA
jgi:hypothetical protein